MWLVGKMLPALITSIRSESAAFSERNAKMRTIAVEAVVLADEVIAELNKANRSESNPSKWKS